MRVPDILHFIISGRIPRLIEKLQVLQFLNPLVSPPNIRPLIDVSYDAAHRRQGPNRIAEKEIPVR